MCRVCVHVCVHVHTRVINCVCCCADDEAVGPGYDSPIMQKLLKALARRRAKLLRGLDRTTFLMSEVALCATIIRQYLKGLTNNFVTPCRKHTVMKDAYEKELATLAGSAIQQPVGYSISDLPPYDA